MKIKEEWNKGPKEERFVHDKKFEEYYELLTDGRAMSKRVLHLDCRYSLQRKIYRTFRSRTTKRFIFFEDFCCSNEWWCKLAWSFEFPSIDWKCKRDEEITSSRRFQRKTAWSKKIKSCKYNFQFWSITSKASSILERLNCKWW